MKEALVPRAQSNLRQFSSHGCYRRWASALVIAAFCCVGHAGVASAQTWTNNWSLYQYVRVIVADPVNVSNLYVGLITDGGYPYSGVYKSSEMEVTGPLQYRPADGGFARRGRQQYGTEPRGAEEKGKVSFLARTWLTRRMRNFRELAPSRHSRSRRMSPSSRGSLPATEVSELRDVELRPPALLRNSHHVSGHYRSAKKPNNSKGIGSFPKSSSNKQQFKAVAYPRNQIKLLPKAPALQPELLHSRLRKPQIAASSPRMTLPPEAYPV